MNTYRIFCRMEGSRRYRVEHCLENPLSKSIAYENGKDELCLLSSQRYKVGVIVNPTKIVKMLIARRNLEMDIEQRRMVA